MEKYAQKKKERKLRQHDQRFSDRLFLFQKRSRYPFTLYFELIMARGGGDGKGG